MPLRIPEKRRIWVHAALLTALLLLAYAALGIGPYAEVSWGQIGEVLLNRLANAPQSILHALDDTRAAPKFGLNDTIIFGMRFPRVVMAILVGAALAMAGALMQGLFRNPLADPGLIGVSSGAAMGGVTAIILLPYMGLSDDWLGLSLPLCAITGGILITFLIYQLSQVGGRIHVASMLLTGIAINAIGGALIGLASTMFADPDRLQSFTFWSLGSLNGILWTKVGITALVLIPCSIAALRLGRPLNAFLFGELEAYHLGVNVPVVKRLCIVLAAVMVGVTVAFTGGIGFIGLVAPHIIRITFGPDHKFLLPASAFCGAILLLVADTVARTIAKPAEVQIGILTALIGGPFFLMLLMKSRKELNF